MNRLPIKVKKYGESSVGSLELIRKVAGELVRQHRKGIPQLVVVSAMAKTTDQLSDMAFQVTERPRVNETPASLVPAWSARLGHHEHRFSPSQRSTNSKIILGISRE